MSVIFMYCKIGPSDTENLNLSDIIFKSCPLFLFLLQREKDQFEVSLLIVHLMKVVTPVCACVE